jgi:hypothetical protein
MPEFEQFPAHGWSVSSLLSPVQAAQLSVSFWAITRLDQVEEPRRAGREAGSRGGLATVTNARATANGRGSNA